MYGLECTVTGGRTDVYFLERIGIEAGDETIHQVAFDGVRHGCADGGNQAVLRPSDGKDVPAHEDQRRKVEWVHKKLESDVTYGMVLTGTRTYDAELHFSPPAYNVRS